MKKLLLTIILLLIITLGACEKNNQDEVSCTVDPSQEVCQTDDITCADNPDQEKCGPAVIEECNHLEIEDGWIPVWCDEFDTDGLPNPDKWSYDVGGNGWGNNELQYYTNKDLDNAYVNDGKLYITAIKESLSGSDYTSARLVSKNKGDWLYGRIEVSAQLPEGTGTWPAIWMLPTDWVYGSWPNSGEIDIMEFVGYDPGVIHGTVHTAAYNHILGTQIGKSRIVSSASETFHTYAIEWERNYIKFFVDNIQYFSYVYNPLKNEAIENYAAWPFDQQFHLILNLAVGGNWGGVEGVDPNIWPQSMVVDYVRVFQKDYVTNDIENPTSITNLIMYDNTSSTINLRWTDATDDMSVKQYNIYLNGNLFGSTTLNNFKLENLFSNTEYEIGIQTEDYAGNVSDIVSGTFETLINNN